MGDLTRIAEDLLAALGLSASQAAVVYAGPAADQKFVVYVFDKSVPDDRLNLARWRGLPLEIVRVKRFRPH
jgi:hypothetical protein